MSDIIDQGNDQAQMLLDLELKRRRPEGPAATGACLNCDDPVGPGVRFCCPECRDDFEHRQKRTGV